MLMNEEPVRMTLQQGNHMIDESFNSKRLRSGPSKQRRDVRKKRTHRDGDTSMNNSLYQGTMYNDDSQYYRHEKIHYQCTTQNESQFQLPQPLNFQQPQGPHSNFQYHQQVPPTSPTLHITPPISSSHPLSSFNSNQPIQVNQSNGHPFMMCSSQVQMPIPMQISMPMVHPMANFDGSTHQMPIQSPFHVPLQMPMHMANMPLPMFIRIPVQPNITSESSNNPDDNLKSNVSNGIGHTLSNGPAIVNLIPLMFPPHLGPMLLGPSQSMMVSHLHQPSPNFHQMVNDNQPQLSPNSQQQQQQSTK